MRVKCERVSFLFEVEDEPVSLYHLYTLGNKTIAHGKRPNILLPENGKCAIIAAS